MSLCGLRTFDIELLCLPSCEIIVLPYAGNHKEKSTWLLISFLCTHLAVAHRLHTIHTLLREDYRETREKAQELKDLADFGYAGLFGKGQTKVTTEIIER